MRLGLIRHFEVDHRLPSQPMNSSDYLKWVEEYDKAGLIKNEVDMLGIDWDKCYASDLLRAFQTAEAIYDGEIISTHLLREVRIQPIRDREESLPYKSWIDLGREAWMRGDPSQVESREETVRRVNTLLDFIKYKERRDANILLVGHEIIMTVVAEELEKREFKGAYDGQALFGKIYLFEN